MAGTKVGGQKAAVRNLANDPDFYRRIGAKGGRNGNTGGFKSDIECSCDAFGKGWPHFKRNCAGKKGGSISRKPRKVADA